MGIIPFVDQSHPRAPDDDDYFEDTDDERMSQDYDGEDDPFWLMQMFWRLDDPKIIFFLSIPPDLNL